MAPRVVSRRHNRPAHSARQKFAQVFREFIEGRGGWIISPLPLADNVALRFDVRSRDAALICNDLSALGLAVRFVTAGLKAERGASIALIREGDSLTVRRRIPAPCAVTTLEIALPDESATAQCNGENSARALGRDAATIACKTSRVRNEATSHVPLQCSRPRPVRSRLTRSYDGA
jgi:hypothetical protein